MGIQNVPKKKKRERFWYRCGPLSLISFQKVDKCTGRGGHKAVALRTKFLEVALEKTAEARERLQEMAMLAMQRERMERLDVYDVWLGMETLRPSSRDSSEPAGT